MTTPGTSVFLELLGLQYDRLEGSGVTAHTDIDERHHQPFGIVHGGIWSAIVETIGSMGGWISVRDEGKYVVGVSNTTDFFRQHTTGRVLVEGTPVHQGRTQQLWQVVISRESDGKMVARGHVRLQVLSATGS